MSGLHEAVARAIADRLYATADRLIGPHGERPIRGRICHAPSPCPLCPGAPDGCAICDPEIKAGL